MGTVVQLLDVIELTNTDWAQPRTEALDALDYSEAAVTVFVTNIDPNGGTTTVSVQTSPRNIENMYQKAADIQSFNAASAGPQAHGIYLAGSGVLGTGQPGFSRYLRVAVIQAAGATITLEVMVVLRP